MWMPTLASLSDRSDPWAGQASISMTGGINGGACAVCKHQRRKCEPNCELAAYFPAHRMNDFRALHLVFGVANLTKLIKANASEASRRRAAETLTWEARWRERDPSEGCYREVACLRRDNALLRADNAALRRQLDEQQQHLSLLCSTTTNRASAGGGGAAAAGTAALLHHAVPVPVPLPPCGAGLLRPPAAHTMPGMGYRGVPTTANDGLRRPVPEAVAIAVRGGGGGQAVDASRRQVTLAAANNWRAGYKD